MDSKLDGRLHKGTELTHGIGFENNAFSDDIAGNGATTSQGEQCWKLF